VLDKEEREDLLWLCRQVGTPNVYYSVATWRGSSRSLAEHLTLPPTGVAVQPVAGAPGELQPHWMAPTEVIDGYLVELKIGPGAYQPPNDMTSLVPFHSTGLRVTLGPGAPDLVDYVVRMRSARADVASSYSNEAVYHRPLNAPKNGEKRFDSAHAAPVVQWDRNSTAATSVAIERSELDADGHQGPWTPLAVADPTAVVNVDVAAITDRSYAYQVANVAGAVTRASAFSWPVFAGLKPPAPAFIYFDGDQQAVALSMSANPGADGIRLERRDLVQDGKDFGASDPGAGQGKIRALRTRV
jgi:hypothetical protein